MHQILKSLISDLLDSSSEEDSDGGDDDTSKLPAYVPDPECIWLSKHPLKVTSVLHKSVHFYCALFAPLSWLHKGNRWFNVAQEVRRSFHFTCSVCGLRGALLSCNNKKCNYGVHLPCAMEQGWIPSLVNKCSYQCPLHCLQDEDNKNEMTQLERSDISLGRESVEVTASRDAFGDVISLPYIYVSKNLNSDETQAYSVNIHKIRHYSPGERQNLDSRKITHQDGLHSCPCSQEVYIPFPYILILFHVTL